MKKAFTMLELVFVIVIVGILSVVAMPSFNRDTLQEAANQVVSHIRYTQHLAMMDDKFASNDANWFKGRWQLQFGKSSSGTKNSGGEYAYSIYSDSGSYSGNPGISELAKNPLNKRQLMSGGYSNVIDWQEARAVKKMNLGKSFGVKNIKFKGGCAVTASTTRIAFDNLGRPIIGNLSSSNRPYMLGKVSGAPLMTQCKIILSSDRNITIAIEPETGYTHIL